MHFSTRDMARIGYLMLRRGNWNGQQLVPTDWVAESTRPFTRLTEMNPPQRRHGAFGQHIAVIPKLDLVVAHKTAPRQRDAAGRARTVPHSQFLQVLELLARAHCGVRC